jgi:hypothetical protein
MTEIQCPTCGRPNPDNQTTCDFCGSPLGSEELDRLDDLLSPQDSTEEVSRLDDLIPQDKTPKPAPEEAPFPDDFSLRDELIEETPQESSQLGEISSDQDLTDSFITERIQPTEPLLPEEPASKTPQDIPDAPSLEPTEPVIDSPQERTDIPVPGPEKPEEEIHIEGDDSTPPIPDIFLETQEPSDETVQPTEPLDDFEPEQMSPGFGDSGWLEMLQDPESPDQFEPEPTKGPSPVKKKETDWLEKIKRLNKSADLVDEDSSFPDWLSVSEKAPPKPPEQPEQPVPEPSSAPPPSEEVPDWLQMDADDEQLSEFLRRKDKTSEEFQPEIPIPTPPVDENGLEEPQEPPEQETESPPQKKFPSWAADGEDLPPGEDQPIPKGLEFLAGIDPTKTAGRAVDPFQIEDELFEDLFSEELPNWLTSASSAGEILPEEDELTVGELPGWVEAMRPVVESTDTTGLSEDEDYIENYGPLAGIPSVLPAEAETALDPEKAIKKPLDLTATKTHQEYVSVLRKLISNESKIKEIKKPPTVQTQRVLRWLISILLLVTIAGTVIFGGSFQTQIPTPLQVQKTGYGALHREISYIGEGQPVLIAFDYQPAAAGELHITAASVVDHIMSQRAYLSFISTQPTGPALAEYFLTSTQSEHEYRHNLEYINLGYLPGESAGLLSFLIAPKKIIPLAFDGSNAWGSPPLTNVNSINDFGMILVITDDPDTAKTWIEQVGVYLMDTPLLMVVSAQVEPLIQPYYLSSPQLLSGYVSGVVDSMNYESLLNKPNLATISWLPFNVGIFVAVGTIFISGLANGFLSLFSRHRARQKGDLK